MICICRGKRYGEISTQVSRFQSFVKDCNHQPIKFSYGAIKQVAF